MKIDPRSGVRMKRLKVLINSNIDEDEPVQIIDYDTGEEITFFIKELVIRISRGRYRGEHFVNNLRGVQVDIQYHHNFTQGISMVEMAEVVEMDAFLEMINEDRIE